MAQKRVLILAGILILLWGGLSIAAYFVAHKPLIIQFMRPISGLLGSLALTAVLILNAFSLGRLVLDRLGLTDSSRIILEGGLGLGALGLLGFGLAAMGAASGPILASIQIALLALFAWWGVLRQTVSEIRTLVGNFLSSASSMPSWMKWASLAAFSVTVLRTLLPPVEAFDALLYHLTIPALWIRDGGLRAYDFPHYWFPGLVEGVFLWGLSLGSEIVPQQIHFVWAILLALLLWHWTQALWGDLAAWWGLMMLISMPSLLLLASWAYTDLALTFYGLATLYCLWIGVASGNTRWWIVSGVFAGLAMGIKYTSFVIPVSAVFLIVILKYRHVGEMIGEVARFSLASVITGLAWYLRNWIWMGNPFYPFAFGGRYWDSFRAAAFSGVGSGIGWDWAAIFALPLTVTLGNQDVNYFDGNIGPLFLLTLPLALLFVIQIRAQSQEQKRAVGIILLFVVVSIAFWVLGYITTRNLWQTRLLIPALVPSILISAAALASASKLDTHGFRASFILHTFAALSIFTMLFDASLGVAARNPLAVVTGIVTRAEYFKKVQPSYFYALELIDRAPEDSRILALFEPWTYGSSRDVQPDPILDRFPHDLYLHETPARILDSWQRDGYTYVLVNIRGADFIYGDNPQGATLDQTLAMLDLIEVSPEGEYALYKVPNPS